MLTPARILAEGLVIAPDTEGLLRAAPPGSVCAVTGEPLASGYLCQDIIPPSTGEWLDLLRGDTHGYLSPEAVAALKNDANLGNRAYFVNKDGCIDGYYPLIARTAAQPVMDPPPPQESPPTPPSLSVKALKSLARDGRLPRPVWSDLVREVWPGRMGQQCLIILATDPKKRVWPFASVGPLGSRTPVLLFDGARHMLRSVLVDWAHLVEVLNLVEEVYKHGFSKRAIERGLYAEWATLHKVGITQAAEWERGLSPLRDNPTFKMAVIIAQKPPPEPPAP